MILTGSCRPCFSFTPTRRVGRSVTLRRPKFRPIETIIRFYPNSLVFLSRAQIFIILTRSGEKRSHENRSVPGSFRVKREHFVRTMGGRKFSFSPFPRVFVCARATGWAVACWPAFQYRIVDVNISLYCNLHKYNSGKNSRQFLYWKLVLDFKGYFLTVCSMTITQNCRSI